MKPLPLICVLVSFHFFVECHHTWNAFFQAELCFFSSAWTTRLLASSVPETWPRGRGLGWFGFHVWDPRGFPRLGGVDGWWAVLSLPDSDVFLQATYYYNTLTSTLVFHSTPGATWFVRVWDDPLLQMILNGLVLSPNHKAVSTHPPIHFPSTLLYTRLSNCTLSIVLYRYSIFAHDIQYMHESVCFCQQRLTHLTSTEFYSLLCYFAVVCTFQ